MSTTPRTGHPGDPPRPPSPARTVRHRCSRSFAAVVTATLVLLTACARADDTVAAPRPDPTATWRAGPPGSAPRVDEPEPTVPAPATTQDRDRAALVDQLQEDLTVEQLTVPLQAPPVGSWRFVDQTANGPVAFDPCRTIPYQVHVGSGPPDGVELVRKGFERLSEVTGLRFEYAGPTSEVPRRSSFPAEDEPVQLSEAFVPVQVGWAQRHETDLWASEGAETLGVGGARTVVFEGGEKMIVSGFAILLPSDALDPGFGPGLTVGNVLLHELAHLVGLDHVDDPAELLHHRLHGETPDGFGPGDRHGLWHLGASRGCTSAWLPG